MHRLEVTHVKSLPLPDTRKLHKPQQDDRVAAFYDIHPAAAFHVLVIPIEHIRDGKSLGYDDLPLLRHMVRVGENLLADKGYSRSQARCVCMCVRTCMCGRVVRGWLGVRA